MWGRRKGPDLIDTEEMSVFFERLGHLNQEQLLALRAAWHSITRETHEAAWTAVREVGVREGLSKEIDRVRNRALGWASRGSNTIPYRISDDVTWQRIGPWLRATEALD